MTTDTALITAALTIRDGDNQTLHTIGHEFEVPGQVSESAKTAVRSVSTPADEWTFSGDTKARLADVELFTVTLTLIYPDTVGGQPIAHEITVTGRTTGAPAAAVRAGVSMARDNMLDYIQQRNSPKSWPFGP